MCRLLAFLVASSASVAVACSCVNGLIVLSPSSGTVPPNARIFVGDGSLPSEIPNDRPRLFSPDGTEFPTGHSVIETGRGTLHVLSPEEELPQVAGYTVRVDGSRISSFDVAGAALSGKPPVPRVVERSGSTHFGEGGGDCGDQFWASWSVAAEGELLLVDRDGSTTFDPHALSGSIAGAHHVASEGLTPTSLGNGGCGGNWDDAEPGAEVQARFGVLDAAGNFSGWSAPDRGEVPLFGCSCGGDGSALLLACLGLLVRARRRA